MFGVISSPPFRVLSVPFLSFFRKFRAKFFPLFALVPNWFVSSSILVQTIRKHFRSKPKICLFSQRSDTTTIAKSLGHNLFSVYFVTFNFIIAQFCPNEMCRNSVVFAENCVIKRDFVLPWPGKKTSNCMPFIAKSLVFIFSNTIRHTYKQGIFCLLI